MARRCSQNPSVHVFASDDADNCECGKWPEIQAREQAAFDASKAEWTRGVDDSIRIVKYRTEIARILGYVPAARAMLAEVEIFLQAMRIRGEYASTRMPVDVSGPHAGARERIPKLDIRCGHKGGPREYHCDRCCPATSVGPSGEVGPCFMHAQGQALDILERMAAPATPLSIIARDKRYGREIDIGDTYLDVDGAERYALEILAEVGAIRRGERT